MPKIFHPENEAAWLQMRAADVTSTESPALFGLSPYCTEFELFHRKREGEVVSIEATQRMRWGQRLERVIAQAIAEEYGVKVRRLSAYMRHDEVEGMGASFDYEVVGWAEPWPDDKPSELRRLWGEHGPGVIEIKNVDYLVFRDNWLVADDGGKTVEPPPHIDVQVQHQLEVVRRNWAAVAVLVAGNDLQVVVREREPDVGAKIAHYVQAFWHNVRLNREPEPDYLRDAEKLRDIYRHAGAGAPLDLRHSNRANELCAEYRDAAAAEKAAKDRKTAASSELLTLIGDAPKAFAAGFAISAGTVAETEVAYTRKAYRNLRVTQKAI